MGDIGEPQREVTFEPLEEPAPQTVPAPVVEPEKVPVRQVLATWRSGPMSRALDRLPTDECVLWTGSYRKDGYGDAKYPASRSKTTAHRAVYVRVIGPIPAGLDLDHLCRTPACVNPAHMEPVTHAENMRRTPSATKTECLNGHPFDEINTYYRRPSGRTCRACSAQRSAAAARKRGAA